MKSCKYNSALRHIRILMTALVSLLATIAVAQQNLPIKRLAVFQTSTPPVLDGKMEDACWKSATPTGDFERYQTGGPAKFRTRAWLCYDVENLYFYFQCLDPEMNKVVGNRPQDKMDESIWQDEEVELFFDPAGQRKSYFQLMCSVLGTKYDMSSVVGVQWHGDRHEHGKGWKAANYRDDEAWYLEIMVPFTIFRHRDEFAATPQPGDLWRVNFYRHVCRTGEFINWNVATRGFHQPERFGELEFKGERGMAAPTVRLEAAELNYGQNIVRCCVTNTTPTPVMIRATGNWKVSGKEAVPVMQKEARIESGRQSCIELPCVIDRGGDWDLSVRVELEGRLLLTGRATKRFPFLDEILDHLSQAKRQGTGILARSRCPADLKASLREQQVRLMRQIEQRRRELRLKSALTQAQWSAILEGVTNLNDTSRQFLRQLSYLNADNRQAGAGAKAGFLVTVHNSLAHIYTDTASGASPRSAVRLKAMRGEGESFQIAVAALWNDVHNVRVTATPLAGPEGCKIDGDNVGVSLIGYLKCKRDPNDLPDAREWFPDTLLPNAPRDIPAYSTQPFWVDIHVPRSAAPGVYKGRVVIETEAARQVVPVELTVRSVALPEVCLLQNDFWISTHGLGWWGYPLTVEKMEEIYRIAQRNHLSAMPSFFIHIYSKVKITRVDQGRYEFDFSDFNPYLLTAKKYGVNAWNPNLECNQGWASFFCGGYGPVKIHDANTGEVTEFANCWGRPPKTIPLEDIWTKTPLFEQFWKAYVKNLKDIGMLESAWYESVDEPNDVTRMDLLLLIHRQLKQWVPELKLMSWGTYPAHHFARARGWVDAWAPQLGWYWEVKDVMQKDQDFNGITQKVYTCGSQARNEKGGYTPDGYVRDPNITRRIVPWMCYTWNIRGYLFFAMNPWPQPAEKDCVFDPEKQPWPTVRQFSGSTCYDLLLPGPNHTFYETIRLKTFRDGMEDYDYLKLLEGLVGQLEKRGGNPALSRNAKQALQIGNDIVTDPCTYTLSPEVLLKRRDVVGDLIEQAMGFVHTSRR